MANRIVSIPTATDHKVSRSCHLACSNLLPLKLVCGKGGPWRSPWQVRCRLRRTTVKCSEGERGGDLRETPPMSAGVHAQTKRGSGKYLHLGSEAHPIAIGESAGFPHG